MTVPTAQKHFTIKAKRAGGFSFTPTYVTSCKKGEHYVCAGMGPAVCKGIESIHVTGIGDVKTYIFEEINKHTPHTLRVPQAKMKDAKIRLLADDATMDAVLVAFESADGSKPSRKNRAQAGSSEAYDKIIRSGDLVKMTELVCKTLGADNTEAIAKGRPTMGMEYGDRAVRIIAGEYALVKGMDFKDAYALLSEKSGKFKSRTPELAQTAVNTADLNARPS